MSAAPFLRLAFRAEDNFWNVYLASHNTMADATLIGSIHLSAVQDERLKTRFMELIKDAVAMVVKEISGAEMSLTAPQREPEHERSGAA